jgi:hypothetical protein
LRHSRPNYSRLCQSESFIAKTVFVEPQIDGLRKVVIDRRVNAGRNFYVIGIKLPISD